jgi:hypothetical protein
VGTLLLPLSTQLVSQVSCMMCFPEAGLPHCEVLCFTPCASPTIHQGALGLPQKGKGAVSGPGFPSVLPTS